MQLEGKVIVITGASRGIGQALSLAFAGEGAFVVAAARRDRGGSGSLEETVGLIEQEGGQALAVRCDVTIPEDVEVVHVLGDGEFEKVHLLKVGQGVVAGVGIGLLYGLAKLRPGASLLRAYLSLPPGGGVFEESLVSIHIGLAEPRPQAARPSVGWVAALYRYAGAYQGHHVGRLHQQPCRGFDGLPPAADPVPGSLRNTSRGFVLGSH